MNIICPLFIFACGVACWKIQDSIWQSKQQYILRLYFCGTYNTIVSISCSFNIKAGNLIKWIKAVPCKKTEQNLQPLIRFPSEEMTLTSMCQWNRGAISSHPPEKQLL